MNYRSLNPLDIIEEIISLNGINTLFKKIGEDLKTSSEEWLRNNLPSILFSIKDVCDWRYEQYPDRRFKSETGILLASLLNGFGPNKINHIISITQQNELLRKNQIIQINKIDDYNLALEYLSKDLVNLFKPLMMRYFLYTLFDESHKPNPQLLFRFLDSKYIA